MRANLLSALPGHRPFPRFSLRRGLCSLELVRFLRNDFLQCAERAMVAVVRSCFDVGRPGQQVVLQVGLSFVLCASV